MIETEDTAVPFPYTRLIVGKRHCRVLIMGNINSDATGFDITSAKSGIWVLPDRNYRHRQKFPSLMPVCQYLNYANVGKR